MNPSALLEMTCELLQAVLRLEAPADAIVSAYFRKYKTLGQRERHT